MARDKIHIDLVLNTKGFRPLGRINGQLGEFEKSLDASNARVLAFGASAGAILAVKKAFTATVKAAIEVEKSLKDINVILGATSANLKKFGSDLFEIASKTGQAFQVAATAATELARQGLGTEETLKRTRDALILARLAGMDAAEAVNALTAAINTFNKAGLDSTTIINKLANVDAAFAVSSDDLAKAIGRVGASAKAAGVGFDQLLAIVTTVQQKTARGGAVIGNSFKTIFTRIQRPAVIKQLEQLGIAIRGVEGNVLPAMKVLQNLARQFDHLSQAQKAQVTEMIGGVFQVNILKAAMSDLSKETGIYNRALAVSLGSSDQALRRNEELNKTLAAQFQRTVNTFKEGAAELGELTLGPALQRMFGFVDDMSKIGESDFGKVGVSIAKSIFQGLGKFISGPGLLVVGLVLFKTFSQLGKFAADAFKTLTGLNKSLATQQNLQRQVFDVLSENPDLLKKIKDGTMTVEEAHEEIFKQIEKNTSALDNQLLVSQQLAKTLMSGGVGFSTDFGATTGKKSRKFGSAGYIPSFAADRGERLGMMAGGYSKSQIHNPKTKQETIHDGQGGVFNATVNGHESVFTTQNRKGNKATFVVPPQNSKAYDEYMSVLSGGFVPNFMAFARLKKGADFTKTRPGEGKTLGRGQASFTGKGEDKIFKALGDKRGTTLMLKDGSAVVSDRPLHGMAAMEAGIDPRTIVGGGFHNVHKGQLSFGESDMTDISELDKVLAGGFLPRRSLSNASRQGLGQSRKFGNKFSLAERAGAAVSGAGLGTRIVADAGTSLVTGGAAGLPGTAWLGDMAGLHGPEIAKGLKRKFKGGKFLEGYGKGTRLEQGLMSGSVIKSGGYIPSFGWMEDLMAFRGKGLKSKLGAQKLFKKNYKKASPQDKESARKALGPIFERNFENVGSARIIGEDIETKINEAKHGVRIGEQGNVRGRLSKDKSQQFADIEGGKKYKLKKGKKGKIDRVVDPTVKVYDAANRFGLLGMYGVKKSNKGYAETSIDEIKELKGKDFGATERIGFQNLQYRSLGELRNKKQTGDFSTSIRKHFAKPMEKVSQDLANSFLPGKGLKPAPIKASGGPLFGVDAEGNIFERSVNALTSTGNQFEATLSSNTNQTWDFKKAGNRLKKNFGFEGALLSADAKRTINDKAEGSIIKKIYSSKEIEYPWHTDIAKAEDKKKKKGAIVSKASGYIPNFNTLFEAVRREKEAGVPAGRIKLGRSDRLRNPGNPSGFGVYNTRDEPMGLTEGINNSMAAGIDPKKRGKSFAGGWLPNFAAWNKGMSKSEVTGAGFSWDKKGVEGFKKKMSEAARETAKLTKATKKQTDGGIRTMVGMAMLQQGLTGLENAVGEQNQKSKAVIQALGRVANALIAAQYLGGRLKESGMGKLSGKGKEAVESGKRSLGQQLQRDNKAKFLKRQRGDTAKFGAKGGGMKGMMARGGTGLARMGGMASAGAAGAAASGVLMGVVAVVAGMNAFAKMMTETDFNPIVKEARLAAKALERTREATEKNIAKLNKFGTAAEQAAEIFNDESATMSQVLDASRKMEEEMRKLPIEFREKLAGIFDPKAVNAMIQAFVAQQQKKAQSAQERKDSADLLKDTREKGGMDILAHPIDSTMNMLTYGNLEGKSKEEKEADKKLTKDMAERMVMRAIDVDQKKFQDLDPADIAAKLGAATTVQEKIKVGEEIGFDKEGMAIWSKWMYEGGDAAGVLVKLTQTLVSKTHAELDTADRLRPIREQILKENKLQIKAIRETKKQLESEQRVRKEVIKITAAGAKSFLTAVGQIRLETQIKIGEARAEKATQFGGVISQGQKALTSAASLPEIVDDAGNSIAGLPQFAGSGLQSGIRTTLNKASRGGIGSVSEQTVDTQKAQLDQMIETIKKNTSIDNVGAQGQIKELQGLKKELENLVGTSGRLQDELGLQTKEIKAAAAAQKMVAEQQRRLKSFGGPQALLDPSKLNPMLSKVISGGKAMAASGRAGSRTGFNRGRINQISGFQDLLGGELPENLRKEGVARATQVGVSQIGAMNQAMGFGMSPEQVRKTAAEQAANLFKGDPQKQNTDALETLNTTLQTNNDLIKHGTADRVELGGMEDKAGAQARRLQIEFFETMKRLQEGDKQEAKDDADIFKNMGEEVQAAAKGADSGLFGIDFQKTLGKDIGGALNYALNAIGGDKGFVTPADIITAPIKLAMAGSGASQALHEASGGVAGSDTPSWEDFRAAQAIDPTRSTDEGTAAFDAAAGRAGEGTTSAAAKGKQRKGEEGGMADLEAKLKEYQAERDAEGGTDQDTTSVNTFHFHGSEVTADGVPSRGAIQAGRNGMDALEKQLYGALTEMPGGQAALNKHAMS